MRHPYALASKPAPHRILGIEFFNGSAQEAIRLLRKGGLLVVPSAPALKDLDSRPGYRDALLSADLAIADSGFMVLIWNKLQRASLNRLSGLEYLRELLLDPGVRQSGNTFWVMASPASKRHNRGWLEEQGINTPDDHIYVAPMYGDASVDDSALLERLDQLRPRHVIVTIGGGTQERLGLYLKNNLSYRPAIYCLGAAIAFLSGDQICIPVWADKLYLGWLFRSLAEPKRHVPRYWHARKLLGLILRHRDALPGLKQ